METERLTAEAPKAERLKSEITAFAGQVAARTGARFTFKDGLLALVRFGLARRKEVLAELLETHRDEAGR